MDYKELIGLLGCRKGNEVCKSSPVFYGFACDRCRETIMQEAAAIETMLAERDAAVEDLKGRCGVCKHRRVCLFDEQHRIGCAVSNGGDWEWRGPREGGGHD